MERQAAQHQYPTSEARPYILASPRFTKAHPNPFNSRPPTIPARPSKPRNTVPRDPRLTSRAARRRLSPTTSDSGSSSASTCVGEHSGDEDEETHSQKRFKHVLEGTSETDSEDEATPLIKAAPSFFLKPAVLHAPQTNLLGGPGGHPTTLKQRREMYETQQDLLDHFRQYSASATAPPPPNSEENWADIDQFNKEPVPEPQTEEEEPDPFHPCVLPVIRKKTIADIPCGQPTTDEQRMELEERLKEVFGEPEPVADAVAVASPPSPVDDERTWEEIQFEKDVAARTIPEW